MSEALFGVIVGGLLAALASLGTALLAQRSDERRDRTAELRSVRAGRRNEAQAARANLRDVGTRILACTLAIRSIEREIRNSLGQVDSVAAKRALERANSVENELNLACAEMLLVGSQRLRDAVIRTRQGFINYKECLDLIVSDDPNATGDYLEIEMSAMPIAERELEEALQEHIQSLAATLE